MKAVDLTGKTFGRLTVIGQEGLSNSGHKKWLCKCDCGSDYLVRGTLLTQGVVSSCGCYRRDMSSDRKTTHGFYYRVSYKRWTGMMDRCYNEKSSSFKIYGGRGIKVCDRWHDYEKFYEDMGDPECGMSIDRIDFNGDYSPENCRWLDVVGQCNNRRSNYWIEHDGERKSLSDWARKYGIKPATLQMRIEKGMSFIDAVTTPVLKVSRGETIEYLGERRTLTQWASRYGLGVTTLNARLKMGWSIHDALTKPLQIKKGINDHRVSE